MPSGRILDAGGRQQGGDQGQKLLLFPRLGHEALHKIAQKSLLFFAIVGGDAAGLVMRPVSLAKGLDRKAEHELVLKIPAPTVFFVAMADNVLKFELICFIGDVETSARVKSDLNFEIFRTFKGIGIDLATMPVMPSTFTLAGLERLESFFDRAPPQAPRG